MFRSHFGLKADPFALSPNLKFLYMSKALEETMAHLAYGLEEGEDYILITGAIGTGKTLALHNLMAQISSTFRTVLINVTQLDFRELMKLICSDLKLEIPTRADKADLLAALKAYLQQIRQAGDKLLLIIDEAQNLSVDTLEGVRLLTNLAQPGGQCLQIVLAGQPGLEIKIKQPNLAQLRQRIRIHYCLETLDRQEVESYVTHRLLVAGCQQPLFRPGALDRIYRASGGVPRLVNILGSRALLAAFVDDAKIVEGRHVEIDESTPLSVTTPEVAMEPPRPIAARDPRVATAEWPRPEPGPLLGETSLGPVASSRPVAPPPPTQVEPPVARPEPPPPPPPTQVEPPVARPEPPPPPPVESAVELPADIPATDSAGQSVDHSFQPPPAKPPARARSIEKKRASASQSTAVGPDFYQPSHRSRPQRPRSRRRLFLAAATVVVVIASLALAWPFLSGEIGRGSLSRSRTQLEGQAPDRSETAIQETWPAEAQGQGDEMTLESGTGPAADGQVAGTGPSNPDDQAPAADNDPATALQMQQTDAAGPDASLAAATDAAPVNGEAAGGDSGRQSANPERGNAQTEVAAADPPRNPGQDPAELTSRSTTPTEGASGAAVQEIEVPADRPDDARLVGPTDPPPPPPPSAGFGVHVASFGELGRAEAFIARLNQLGYPAFFVRKVIGGETWNRVYVGPFMQRQQAQRYSQNLQSQGVAEYYFITKFGDG